MVQIELGVIITESSLHMAQHYIDELTLILKQQITGILRLAMRLNVMKGYFFLGNKQLLQAQSSVLEQEAQKLLLAKSNTFIKY